MSELSEYMEDPEFLKLQETSNNLQVVLDEVLYSLNKKFPLDVGIWTISASGKFLVAFPEDD
jgi:hypothetical protein